MKKAKRIIIFLTASSLILLTVMVIQQKNQGQNLRHQDNPKILPVWKNDQQRNLLAAKRQQTRL